jgi:multidrug resistance protein, MATE family
MPDNLAHPSDQGVRAEAGRLLALAWPIILSGLNWTLMQIIDVAVVGHYGTDDLAALGASRTLTFIAIVLGISALTGVLVFTAQADGGGRLKETGDDFRSGLMLGTALGAVVMIVLGGWAEELLALIDVEPAMRAPAARVVEAMAIAFPAQLAFYAASYFLEGISRPRSVMTVNLLMLPLNAVLAWAWVGGRLGFPEMGAVGAGLATAAASWAGAGAMILFAWFVPDAGARGVRDFSAAALRRAARGVPRLAWFGTIPATAASLELAGFAWLMVLSTQLGNAVAAGFQAMLAVHNLFFAIGYGFASAAGVRVGNAVGAGEPEQAWRRALIAAGLSGLIVGFFSLLLVLFPAFAVQSFSNDPAVLAPAASMLVIMAAFLVFDGWQYLFAASLRSMNEQVWAGVNGIIGFFLVTGGSGWLLVRAGWGADGLAWAAAFGMLATAALQFGRFAWVARLRPFRSAARSSG